VFTDSICPGAGLHDFADGEWEVLSDSSLLNVESIYAADTTTDSLFRMGVDLISIDTTRNRQGYTDTLVQVWEVWRYNDIDMNTWSGSWRVTFKIYNDEPSAAIFEGDPR